MSDDDKHRRLSDYIFNALMLSLEQKDLDISELLTRALEQAMTRNAGGPDFVERREFSEKFEKAIVELQALRDAEKHKNKA